MGELVAFLVVSVALVANLWFGVCSRFRAGEVHPFLPGITDLVVATITVGDALLRPSEPLPFTLVTAVLLVGFAGVNLRLLGKAAEVSTRAPAPHRLRRGTTNLPAPWTGNGWCMGAADSSNVVTSRILTRSRTVKAQPMALCKPQPAVDAGRRGRSPRRVASYGVGRASVPPVLS